MGSKLALLAVLAACLPQGLMALRNSTNMAPRNGTNMKLPFLPGERCTQMSERCAGSDFWCGQAFKSDEAATQEECFQRRRRHPVHRIEWARPSVDSDCLPHIEGCSGTESMCGHITDLDRRLSCFKARKKAGWTMRDSPECPKPGTDEDERCAGVKAWCRAEERLALYGNETSCLEFRRHPLKATVPWMEPQQACPTRFVEPCRGTEDFCGSIDKKPRRRMCFEHHELRPYDTVLNASRCALSWQGSMTELCQGSHWWCHQSKVAKRLYGSAEECLRYREKPPQTRRPFYPPVEGECQPGADPEKECLGTEHICLKQMDEPNRPRCLEERTTAPWYDSLPQPSCNQTTERCQRSARWCLGEIADWYGSSESCYKIRGWATGSLGDVVRAKEEAWLERLQAELVRFMEPVILHGMLHMYLSAAEATAAAQEKTRRLIRDAREKTNSQVQGG
ncbi:hypothetical protein CDD83_10795 [Cordyceps sp. RAO-2017]|nr:hypothetical protein CDD83_10795 [Cordyceps sp. RAO-2017]